MPLNLSLDIKGQSEFLQDASGDGGIRTRDLLTGSSMLNHQSAEIPNKLDIIQTVGGPAGPPFIRGAILWNPK